MVSKKFKPVVLLTTATLTAFLNVSANAVTFDVYNDINTNNYDGTGIELANGLTGTDSGINILTGTSQFQGNFNNSLAFSGEGGDNCGIECGDGGDLGATNYGSASFFSGLNFGSIGSTDFVLPDGILLTSGSASLAETNTSSAFTGTASGQGDAGLDALLSTLPGGHTSSDATVLSFDFTVDEGVNAISLDMIFGTEEYSEYINSYPEIAAVFIDGTNYAGFADGNLLTLTGSTVDSGNFFNNDPFDNAPVAEPLAIEYDGISAPLNLLGLLDSSLDTHTIKIAVSDTNDGVLDTGLFVANLHGLALGDGTTSGSTPDDAILPTGDTNPDDGFDFEIFVGDLGVGIDPSQPIFIDPYVATGYEYTSAGSNFATVLIPGSYGDDKYNLYVWNGTDYDFIAEILTGSQFSFLAAGYASGVSQFMIDGIEVDAGLDPLDPLAFVTGLTFTSGGSFNITQEAIQTCDGAPDCFASASVPEPGSLLLMAGGILSFWRASKRKRS